MSKSPHNFVCFYSDIGRPYLPLIERMTASAKRVMPDCRTTILTTTPSKKLFKLFDEHVVLETECDAKNICFVKARAIITWHDQLKAPAIFVDPDIEFQRRIPDINADIGLLRTHKTAHPINSSFIYTTPGNNEFWKKYGNVVASLPHQLRSWYADQIALGIMIGSLHEAGAFIRAFGSNVLLMPHVQVCCEPERAQPDVWALHYKGARKGDGWEEYYSKRIPQDGELAGA